MEVATNVELSHNNRAVGKRTVGVKVNVDNTEICVFPYKPRPNSKIACCCPRWNLSTDVNFSLDVRVTILGTRLHAKRDFNAPV